MYGVADLRGALGTIPLLGGVGIDAVRLAEAIRAFYRDGGCTHVGDLAALNQLCLHGAIFSLDHDLTVKHVLPNRTVPTGAATFALMVLLAFARLVISLRRSAGGRLWSC